MSKIHDVLNKRFGTPTGSEKAIQEELAKTFFHAKQPKKKKKDKFRIPHIPWIVASCASLLALFVILFRSNIDVKVNIMGKAPRITGKEGKNALVAAGEAKTLFVEKGKPNEYFVKEMGFFGDAKNFSKEAQNMLVLVNAEGDGWANFSIDLKDPMDLDKLDISYVAKGQTGDENLVIVLVDTDNKSFRMERDLSSKLKSEWREYTINLNPARGVIDMSRISAIRFEFGNLTAGNGPYSTIFLRDVSVKRKHEV